MERGNETAELFSREAEQCIVAALFGSEAVDVYNQLTLKELTSADFYFGAYGLVFDAVGDLIGRGDNPDRTTLATYIKSKEGFTEAAQVEIQQAVAAPYSARNIERYADLIIEKSRARKISIKLAQLQGRVQYIGGDLSSDDVVREMDTVSLSLGERSATNGLMRKPTAQLQAVVQTMEDVQNGLAKGVRTGLTELDEKLGGMQDGELIIVAARPSMGKSALALDIAAYAAIRDEALDRDNPPLGVIFSCEMPEVQLVQRMLSSLSGVEYRKIRRAELEDADWVHLSRAFELYETCDIRIDPASHLTPSILRAKVRQLERQAGKKVSFIIVDYLQLMAADGANQNRTGEISEISRHLKLLAKDFEAPVIALSQLNRSLESRNDKRPMLSDLRESGAIEQDADVILFIYRDEYYNPDSPAKGMAEIIIGKGRNSGTGMVPVQFQGQYQRFRDMPMGAYSYENSYGG